MFDIDTYKVIIEGLQLPIRLGCTAEERKTYQNAELDLEFELKAGRAVSGLDQTVCYASAAQIVRKLAADQEWDLIEKFLPVMAEDLFSRFPALRGIRANLKKFVIAGTKSAGVKMVFKRKN